LTRWFGSSSTTSTASCVVTSLTSTATYRIEHPLYRCPIHQGFHCGAVRFACRDKDPLWHGCQNGLHIEPLQTERTAIQCRETKGSREPRPVGAPVSESERVLLSTAFRGRTSLKRKKTD